MRQKKLKPEGVRCELLLPLERGPEWGRGRHQTWPAGRGRPGPTGAWAGPPPSQFWFPGKRGLRASQPAGIWVPRGTPASAAGPPLSRAGAARPPAAGPTPPSAALLTLAREATSGQGSVAQASAREPRMDGAERPQRRCVQKKKTKAGRHKGFVVRGFSPCERARRVCAGCRAPALPAGPLSRRAREGPAQAPTSHHLPLSKEQS